LRAQAICQSLNLQSLLSNKKRPRPTNVDEGVSRIVVPPRFTPDERESCAILPPCATLLRGGGNRCAVTGAPVAGYLVITDDFSPTRLQGVVSRQRRPALQPRASSLYIAGTWKPVPLSAVIDDVGERITRRRRRRQSPASVNTSATSSCASRRNTSTEIVRKSSNAMISPIISSAKTTM